MPQSTCTVAACDRPISHKTLGLCHGHYHRYWRHGDVQADVPLRAPSKRREFQDFSDGTRSCASCKDRLPLAYFHRDKQSPGGRRTICPSCRSGIEAARYEADRERVSARVRQYRVDNPAMVRAQDSERYERNKDKRIALAIAASHARRARLLGSGYEHGITVPALRKRDGDSCHYCKQTMVFGRFRAGERPGAMGTLEHVQPISRGGTHSWDNCVLACWRCNSSRGNRAWQPQEHHDDRAEQRAS